MTLGVLWIRNAGADVFELCVASHSRLTGGTAWDCAQKVFPLPRGDSVLAFAGDTTHAYPLITQTLNYVLSYERAQHRALDLCGDKDAAAEATARLLAVLHSERREEQERTLDMEPFSILVDIINGGDFYSVGGAPQLVKAFRHMNSRPYNVRWPSADAPAFLFGRELLDYEINRFLVLNPETLKAERWPTTVGSGGGGDAAVDGEE